jgi:hypothetical protein
LSEIVKMDVVSKNQYEQKQEDLNRCSKELGSMKAGLTRYQSLEKEIAKRDKAIQSLSDNLFPIGQPPKTDWNIVCPTCRRLSMFYSDTKDSESLLQSGYITFECIPCGQKTNLTLKDLYQNILQQGYFGIRM